MSIRVSQVEICWTLYSNYLYNVQYRSDLTTNVWVDLFPTNILATGSETCVYDDIPHGRPQSYARAWNCLNQTCLHTTVNFLWQIERPFIATRYSSGSAAS